MNPRITLVVRENMTFSLSKVGVLMLINISDFNLFDLDFTEVETIDNEVTANEPDHDFLQDV